MFDAMIPTDCAALCDLGIIIAQKREKEKETRKIPF